MAENPTPERITLEQGKKLSESMLWEKKKAFFQANGIQAWSSEVPYEISCNLFTANSYAQIILAFIKDTLAKNPDAMNQPFYILELGAGTGKFSFYLVKTLLDLIELAGWGSLQLQYVISDVSDVNFAFLQEHSALQPYIEAGIIDFAIYEPGTRNPIELQFSQLSLTDQLVNPLITIANNVFESLPCDLYSAINGVLKPILVGVQNDPANMIDNEIQNLNEVVIDYSLSENPEDKYDDPAIDTILDYYRAEMQATNVLIPIAAIRTIGYLNELADNNMLLIVTGSGHSTAESLENLDPPDFNFYGNHYFTMMINFNALSIYCQQLGGDALLEKSRDKMIETGVFVTGSQFAELHETRIVAQSHVQEFSPCDYIKLEKHIADTVASCDLDTLVSHLSLSRWNPDTYELISDRIDELAPEGNPDVVAYLSDNMEQIADNYYDLPDSTPILLAIGYYFLILDQYYKAIIYYETALPFGKGLFFAHYNLGLCFFAVDDNENAMYQFNAALEINPDSEDVRKMIHTIQEASTAK